MSDSAADSKRLPVSAIAFLVLTAAISLVVSHYRLLWFDEYLMLNTDSVHSLRQLVRVQRTAQLSLDPFAYHLFAYLAIRVFGLGTFALRLPSLLGFLLMQVCLFRFVRRIASERAALFAMIFPSVLYVQYFAVDGRPYGLQLGLYALVLLCWQSAVRRESGRAAALTTLAIALAIVVNTHFFAFLLLIPLYAAEAVRVMQRRRVDWAMLVALGIGTAAVALTLPFAHGAAVFREHYIALNVNAGVIPLIYRTLLVFPDGVNGIGRASYLAVLIFGFVWGCVRLVRRPVQGMTRPEYVLLITLAALPFFGWGLAAFVTHSIFARYVIGTTLGMVMLESVAVAPVLESRWVSRIVFGVMMLVVLGHGVQRVRQERRESAMRLARLAAAFTPEIKSEIAASPSGLIYVQDLETYFFARFYEPDAEVRSRLALVVSQPQELRVMHQDTNYLQGTHAGSFTDMRVVPYEKLTADPGELMFLDLHNRFEWLDVALAGSQAKVTYLGPAFGTLKPEFAGEFVAVRFR